MSLSAFSRYFRKMAGKPFTHFVKEVRIARASRLLIESPQSISETAFACGYGSLSNFNRCFRLHTGLSPSEFRTRHHQTSPRKVRRTHVSSPRQMVHNRPCLFSKRSALDPTEGLCFYGTACLAFNHRAIAPNPDLHPLRHERLMREGGAFGRAGAHASDSQGRHSAYMPM